MMVNKVSIKVTKHAQHHYPGTIAPATAWQATSLDGDFARQGCSTATD